MELDTRGGWGGNEKPQTSSSSSADHLRSKGVAGKHPVARLQYPYRRLLPLWLHPVTINEPCKGYACKPKEKRSCSKSHLPLAAPPWASLRAVSVTVCRPMPTTGMGGGKAIAIDGRPSGRLHRCVTLVVTLQYRRAAYGRVYACIDLKQQTDVRTTPIA